VLQVLQPIFESGFSESSYGFRPGRNAWQAVQAARDHVRGGRGWVVDLDLAKFFDRVNHDLLMARVAREVKDTRVLGLIRRFLQAGLMRDGLVQPRREGTPQGGPLSPLLSNIMLTDLDRELERRGHAFARYADDCNVYLGSRKAPSMRSRRRNDIWRANSNCRSIWTRAGWRRQADATSSATG
jgi:RNA-directed DNA polymerase